ncbi:MAG: hypothetical protein Q8K38_06175 [Burkholderiaceae bacterium]|nr:hypothetical protein [Burkholderiaceae bacterium]MDZ4143717.1 hypothetical protein [Burkholderiales bacterium]
MTITVDTANAAMNLIGGGLALLAALLTLLAVVVPREGAMDKVRTLASRAASTTPQALSLFGAITFTFLDSQNVGLGILGVALAILSVQFLRRPGPASRVETFTLVFQSCMFTAFVAMHLLSRLTPVLENLIKVLAK